MTHVIEKIVLKYKPGVHGDSWWEDQKCFYVGLSHPSTALAATEFPSMERALAHSKVTALPTEVKVLKITIEEIDT